MKGPRAATAEFSRGQNIQRVYCPEESNAVTDDPRITVVVMSPDDEWREDSHIAERLGHWPRELGRSPRLYPAALVRTCGTRLTATT